MAVVVQVEGPQRSQVVWFGLSAEAGSPHHLDGSTAGEGLFVLFCKESGGADRDQA